MSKRVFDAFFATILYVCRLKNTKFNVKTYLIFLLLDFSKLLLKCVLLLLFIKLTKFVKIHVSCLSSISRLKYPIEKISHIEG